MINENNSTNSTFKTVDTLIGFFFAWLTIMVLLVALFLIGTTISPDISLSNLDYTKVKTLFLGAAKFSGIGCIIVVFTLLLISKRK